MINCDIKTKSNLLCILSKYLDKMSAKDKKVVEEIVTDLRVTEDQLYGNEYSVPKNPKQYARENCDICSQRFNCEKVDQYDKGKIKTLEGCSNFDDVFAK